MASASTTTNTELPRQSSICSLSTFIADLQNQNHLHNHHRNAGEFHGGEDDEASSMDDLLKNIYSDPPQQPPPVGVDEVWKRIVAGEVDQSTGVGGDAAAAMTLEDFLTKNGAVREEDVRVTVDAGGGVGVGVGGGFGPFQGDQMVVYGGNGGGAIAPVGRGKRRAVEEPLDKATQQKQRRMIKNRESAARSRERKQAYTVELEALVTQLEEENARLLREEAQRNQDRYKQLLENLIPVVESKEKKMAERFNLGVQVKKEKIMENSVPEAGKNVTRVVLRRVCSMEW